MCACPRLKFSGWIEFTDMSAWFSDHFVVQLKGFTAGMCAMCGISPTICSGWGVIVQWSGPMLSAVAIALIPDPIAPG